jgi:hypothetical protein
MPATTLDDGGWGQIAAGLAESIAPDPYKRARMMMAGASYRKTELESEKLREQQAAQRASIEAYPATIEPFPEGPASPQRQAMLDAQRRLRIADNAAATWQADSATDYARGVHSNRGMGAIAAGIPAGQAQQDVIQTQISPISGSLPNYAATPHTTQSIDPATGEPVGVPITSRRMPDGPATLLAPKSQTVDPKGLGDETFRLTKIKEAIDTIETLGPGSLPPAKLRETELAIAMAAGGEVRDGRARQQGADRLRGQGDPADRQQGARRHQQSVWGGYGRAPIGRSCCHAVPGARGGRRVAP